MLSKYARAAVDLVWLSLSRFNGRRLAPANPPVLGSGAIGIPRDDKAEKSTDEVFQKNLVVVVVSA